MRRFSRLGKRAELWVAEGREFQRWRRTLEKLGSLERGTMRNPEEEGVALGVDMVGEDQTDVGAVILLRDLQVRRKNFRKNFMENQGRSLSREM